MNLKDLMLRSQLMRCTTRLEDGHRAVLPDPPPIMVDNRMRTVLDLGYYCYHHEWPHNDQALEPSCEYEGCVMHLEYEQQDDQLMQLVVQYRPKRTLAESFREGRRKGWLKGVGSYSS